LAMPTAKHDLLKLSGNDTKMGAINELFDSGREAEARALLRMALEEVMQNLDRVMAEEAAEPHKAHNAGAFSDVISLALQLETK
jgi:hypothetical protein